MRLDAPARAAGGWFRERGKSLVRAAAGWVGGRAQTLACAAGDWLDGRRYHLAVAALALGLAASPSRPLAVGLAAGLALAAAACRAPCVALIAAGATLVGATAGGARVAAIDGAAARVLGWPRADGLAVVLEPPHRTRFGSWAVVELRSGPARGTRIVARASGGMTWPMRGEPGTEVRLSGSVSPPREAPGSRMDWPAHLRRRGIAAEVALDSLRATGRRRGGPSGAIDSLRRRAEAALSAGTAPDRATVARGMVLGQDEEIDPLVRDDFRGSGLGHLLAVSGQNVMLLCALALPLLAAAGLGVRGRVVALLGLIGLYVPLAGAGASLQRAAVMGAAGLVALALGRPSSRWYALLLAAVVTLAVDPLVAGEPGWQLSFAAVAGILLVAPPLRRAFGGLPRPLAEGAAMTVAATLATAPISAYHFGTVSLAGLVANLVALPLVAPIFWLGMLQAGLGIAAALAPPFAGVAMAAAGALGAVNGPLIGALLAVARDFAGMPGARLGVPLGSPLAVAAAYAAMAVGALGLRRLARRAEPRARSTAGAWRRASLPRRAALVGAAVLALSLGWARATGPSSPPRQVTVSFLDVGQGDATLIQDGPGAAVLFDGGPPEARVWRRLGVRRLALIVATHASRDHHGGLLEVLRRIPADALLDGGDGSRDPTFRAVLAQARARGVRVLHGAAGSTLHAGRLAIRVLGPPPRPPGPPPADPNPRGIAAVVSAGSFDLFLSADAESPALLGYDLPPVEAMKVPHHGSGDPGLPQVLRRLRPRVAAIEVGAGNPYGHPAAPTIAALRAAVPHVYRTDRDGTVQLVARGGSLAVRTGY